MLSSSAVLIPIEYYIILYAIARAREPSEKETRTQNRYEIDYNIIIFVGKRGKIDRKTVEVAAADTH